MPLNDEPFLQPYRRPRRRTAWVPGVALLAISAGVLAWLLACGAILLFILPQPELPPAITVQVANDTYQLHRQTGTVADALRDLNVAVGQNDRVAPPLTSTLMPGLLIQVQHARTVKISVDGRAQSIQTTHITPLDILKDAGIAVSPRDRVLVDGTKASQTDLLLWPVPPTSITIQRPFTVIIDDDGKSSSIQTLTATVGEALFEAGITLYLADVVIPDLNTPITPDTKINIRRSRPISIVADGVTLETRAQGATVASALTSAGVTLQGLDYAIPGEDTPLVPGMLIRIIRVTEQVIVEQETLRFETVWRADGNLELDQRQVAQEGQNGIRQKNVRIRYENGVEISRQEEANTIARQPVNRVIAYGTQIILKTIDTPEGPRQYWRKLRMYATSYHPAALGGDDITATGRKLTKGVVGIDPKVISYNTQLYVPGYGVGVAADTGGPRSFRLWIDLGYDDANWVSWSRYVDVYLLAPAPDKIIYLLPDK